VNVASKWIKCKREERDGGKSCKFAPFLFFPFSKCSIRSALCPLAPYMVPNQEEDVEIEREGGREGEREKERERGRERES
jgi:hypothetical protein